ncbi:MAG: 16S rRNA (guanine(966)-N(2))-methyltransferase RsmD [Clostridiales bacterium]|nr:16S rRNA (guanine(966)-N(2))-methyltransferase RsmD [Clostridiales bacterium]
MRIISGKWGSRKLHSPAGVNTRPTSDRVKEAVFNMISHRLTESVVLDIFAGSGNLGFEALSRGSSRVTFIDNDIRAVRIIDKNARMLECLRDIHIIKKEASRAIESLSNINCIFDIIFMDPPYAKKMEIETLEAIIRADIIKERGLIIVEHASKVVMPDKIENVHRLDTRKYGNTSISFYTRGVHI